MQDFFVTGAAIAVTFLSIATFVFLVRADHVRTKTFELNVERFKLEKSRFESNRPEQPHKNGDARTSIHA